MEPEALRINKVIVWHRESRPYAQTADRVNMAIL